MVKMNLRILLITLLGIILLTLQPTVKISEIKKNSQTYFSHCINFLDNFVDSFVNYPFWKLYFDGYKYNDRASACCILISLDGEKTMLSYILEFQCTNNTAEYEALIQGLNKAIRMNVYDILVFGDSKNVVKQV
jgi:hypothetical protein